MMVLGAMTNTGSVVVVANMGTFAAAVPVFATLSAVGSNAHFYNTGSMLFSAVTYNNKVAHTSFVVEGILTNVGTLDMRADPTGSIVSGAQQSVNLTTGYLFLGSNSALLMTGTSSGTAFNSTLTFTGAGTTNRLMFANRVLQGTGTLDFGSVTAVVLSSGTAGAPNVFEVAGTVDSPVSSQFKLSTLLVGGTSSFLQLRAAPSVGADTQALYLGTLSIGNTAGFVLDVAGGSISTNKTGGLLFSVPNTAAFGTSRGSIAFAGASFSSTMSAAGVGLFAGSGATLDLTQSRFIYGTAGTLGSNLNVGYLVSALPSTGTQDGNLFVNAPAVATALGSVVTNTATWSGRGTLGLFTDVGAPVMLTNMGTIAANAGGTFTLRNVLTMTNVAGATLSAIGANSVLAFTGLSSNSVLSNYGNIVATDGATVSLAAMGRFVNASTGVLIATNNGTVRVATAVPSVFTNYGILRLASGGRFLTGPETTFTPGSGGYIDVLTGAVLDLRSSSGIIFNNTAAPVVSYWRPQGGEIIVEGSITNQATLGGGGSFVLAAAGGNTPSPASARLRWSAARSRPRLPGLGTALTSPAQATR
jgi:hypothetical protein